MTTNTEQKASTETAERQRAERRDNGVRKTRDGRYQARPTLGVDPATNKQVRVMRVGQQLAPSDLLMSRPDGTWLPVRDYSRMFDTERKAAGLPRITLRNVRHSSVSRMRERGIGTDVVASWHGHHEQMTQRIYSKVTDDRLAAAAAAISHLPQGVLFQLSFGE
jgi:integrase